MNPFNKPFESLLYSDVVNFCEKGLPEGINLDYKVDVPKNLSRHFASFSNTSGGIVIIGVKEDKVTGTPIEWKGITRDAKTIERVDNFASNVFPVPNYGVHEILFPDDDSRAFLIIEVLEGSSPPYFVFNESNVWVRTGSINNPIDIAKPDWIKMLIEKEKQSEKARENILHRVREVYKYGLIKEKGKLEKLIKDFRPDPTLSATEHGYFKGELGSNTRMCEVTITPNFPQNTFCQPSEIMNSIENLRPDRDPSFPSYDLEPMPDGVMHFSHDYTGYIECQQIYSNGTVYNNFDVSLVEKDIVYIEIGFIAGRFLKIVRSAKKFYDTFGYRGNLYLSIYISNILGATLRTFSSNPFGPKSLLAWLPDYQLELRFSTSEINNEEGLKKIFKDLVTSLHWGMGFKEIRDSDIEKFITNNKIKFD